MSESDGIEEAFEGQLRVLVSAAGRVGERIARARAREDALRRAQAASEQEACELRSRMDAEHSAARTEFASVHRADWWDRAGAEQIGHTYQVARAWAHEDPEAVRAEERMRDEVRTRHGLDVEDTGADPAAVRAAVERAEQERAQADAERTRSAAENAEAQRLMQQADHEDQQADAARGAAERATTVGAVDVHYGDRGGARAALVVCRELTFSSVESEHVDYLAQVEPYEPGALFKRELPCIRAVLSLGPHLDLLVIDGYATLDSQGRPGLGAHASEALGIPVIGVAKTPFRTATHAAEVIRGIATRPLYVTAAGLEVAKAARIVRAMAGPNRIPDALARVDHLARGRDQPIIDRSAV